MKSKVQTMKTCGKKELSLSSQEDHNPDEPIDQSATESFHTDIRSADLENEIKEAEKEERKLLGLDSESEPSPRQMQVQTKPQVGNEQQKPRFFKYETKGHQHEHELSIDSGLIS